MYRIHLIVLFGPLISSISGQPHCVDYKIDENRANVVDCSLTSRLSSNYKEILYINDTHEVKCYVEYYIQCVPGNYKVDSWLQRIPSSACLGCCDPKTNKRVPAQQDYLTEYFAFRSLCLDVCIEEVSNIDIANGCKIY